MTRPDARLSRRRSVAPRRLVETSSGFVLVDIVSVPGQGLGVGVSRFADDGWEERAKMWLQTRQFNIPNQTLDVFLGSSVGIADEEASRLADQILGPWMTEWGERGGAEQAAVMRRISLSVAAIFAAVGVVAAVGAGAITRFVFARLR